MRDAWSGHAHATAGRATSAQCDQCECCSGGHCVSAPVPMTNPVNAEGAGIASGGSAPSSSSSSRRRFLLMGDCGATLARKPTRPGNALGRSAISSSAMHTPIRTPKPASSPLAATPKSIKVTVQSPGSQSSPSKLPKGRVRVAQPQPGELFAAPMSPGVPAGSRNISMLKASVAQAAAVADSPSSPAVRHWFVGESRRCQAWVMDAEGPVSSMRFERAWPVPPPAPGEVGIPRLCVSWLPPSCGVRVSVVCSCAAARHRFASKWPQWGSIMQIALQL